MSASAQENTSRKPRNTPADAAPPANGADTQENTTSSLGNVTLEIASMDVTLPVKFAPGHMLTENQAKVLDAAYQRQFTNNQNASAKSRAEAYTKATTDAEKAAKTPLTAAQIADLYNSYEPAVGGTPRQSMMEKLRQDAAWRFWVSFVTDHNENVKNNGTSPDYVPVITKAGNKPVQLPTGKGSPEKREAMSAMLLTLPAYAERIQVHLDAIMAERGTRAPAPAADSVVASGADLF